MLLAGAGVFAGGVVALFTIDNSAGSLFLVTLGVGLVLGALLERRLQLEALELFGARIRVRDVVRSRLERADAVGPTRQDGPLRNQAVALQKLGRLYDLYRYVRRTQPFSSSRTQMLDQLARRMQAVGREAEFDPADVSTWFHEGDDALRVVALNLMLAREESRDFFAALRAIDDPRSSFEQYYGLTLATELVPGLEELEQRLLADAVRSARKTLRVRRDASLRRRADSLLALLEGAA